MRRISGVLCLMLVGGWAGCTEPQPEPGQYEAALRQAKSCEEVLEAIQQDALTKIDLELQAFETQQYYGGPVLLADDVRFDGAEGGASGAPTAGADGDSAEEPPSGFSDTNRQVADVDEADIVKVGDEGWKLYVIRGDGFHEFDSWPAAQTSKAADLQIEGGAIEMFVEGNRAVVFSYVNGVEALEDEDPCNGYGGPEPALADYDGAYYCGPTFVKITVIALGGDSPEAIRELYVEGGYTSSRRHNNIVRAVVQTHMQQPSSVPYLWDFIYGAEPYPQSREEEIDRARTWAVMAKTAILETTLDQWLPIWGEKKDGEIVEQEPQCTDFYSPLPGMTDQGITQIVGLDIEDDGETEITSILGWATQVYSNSKTLVLTQPDWSWYERNANHDRTMVHRFAVSPEGQRTPYQGSGFVQGSVHNQFSIDERGGIIRIATTRTTWQVSDFDGSGGTSGAVVVGPPVTHNLLSTMKLEGDALAVIGSTPPLAEGETIRSARFVGDIGYIVTFRQIDPLFAIDLRDPENPTVLGELKIPGFSSYMHPLGDDHLLTIGRDIDEVTQFDRGTALQIFNVSNPAEPMLAHKALVGEGFSEANHNHKAFNFYADKGLLAFPFVSYELEFSSTLELWDVDVKAGFNRRGAVDHSDLLSDCGGGGWDPGGVPFEPDAFYYDCGYQPQITRGVFIDEFIYSISHGGVRVHNVGDLTSPVATATY